jgi:hypothetical protein
VSEEGIAQVWSVAYSISREMESVCKSLLADATRRTAVPIPLIGHTDGFARPPQDKPIPSTALRS